MAKSPKCRICLAEDVHMYKVNNKKMQNVYEKLTDVPFVTGDSRPMLACFFCCTKLKQCCQLQRKCLEAERLFAKMLNEDYEPKYQDLLTISSGLIITPTVHVSIFEESETESAIVSNKELSDDCEQLDNIIEPKEEHEHDESELEYQDIEYLDSFTDHEDMTSHRSESEDIPQHNSGSEEISKHKSGSIEKPLMDFETEVKIQHEVSMDNRKAETVGRKPVGKKPQIDKIRRPQLEVKPKKSQPSALKCIQTVQNRASKSLTNLKESVSIKSSTVNNCISDKTKKENIQNIDVVKNNLDTNCRSYSNENNLMHKITNYNNKGDNRDNDVNIRQSLCVGEKLFKCDMCSREFTRECNMKRHTCLHSVKKAYKCDICQHSFISKDYLTLHVVRIHNGDKPYECDVCQHRFISKCDLTRHIRIHTGEKPYKCDVCQKSFAVKSTLKTHVRLHTGEKPYKCDLCQRSFQQKISLNRHIAAHTGPYKCDVCHHSFISKDYLTLHVVRIHTGEKPYKCDVCQKSFAVKSTLTTHVRLHTGEKPYKCDVCQYRFISKCDLTRHIRIHTGEKPYKCDVCHHSFISKDYLRTHIRTHTGEKPYKCNVCQHSSARKANLNLHIRRKHTHTSSRGHST